MTNWIELAERCEKATRPDREIDGLIYMALVTHPPTDWKVLPETGQIYAWGRPAPHAPGTGGVWAKSPSYTASLDAITALIERELPAAWAWTLGQNIHHRAWGVSINNLDEDGAPYSVCWGSSATTPALALCAAFCRAMAAKLTMLAPQ